MRALSLQEANAYFDLLLRAGAREPERHTFVHYMTTPARSPRDYFFGGVFPGGKAHWDGFEARIGYYPEHAKPDLDELQAYINERLKRTIRTRGH